MIIVTGGAGFIGWHLCQYLLSWDKQVLCVDDLRSSVVGIDELRELQGSNPNFTFWRCSDVEATERIYSRDNIEAIFHLASPVGPVGVLEEAGSIALSIIKGAWHISDVAIGHKCPLIFVSTSEVYGGGDIPLSEEQYCLFSAMSSARKEYALGKLAAECALTNMQPDLDVRIIRPFNVAGPRQNAEKGFVVPRFVQQALDGKPLTVFGTGTDKRAMTHVLDVVEGLWAAYLRGKSGEVYNLGNDDNIIFIDVLADLIAQHPLSANGGAVVHVDPKELFPGYVGAPDKFPNPDKAMRELMWSPTRTVHDIIDDAYQWEVNRRGMQ